MKKPKVLVLKANGTNRDEEMAYAFNIVGGNAKIVLISDLREGKEKLESYQIMALPGGFAYGDDIVSGKILAIELTSFLGEQMKKFIERKDTAIIGVCNGFQVLVRTGLLPFREFGQMSVSLNNNDSGHFECRWIKVKVNNKNSSKFLQRLKDQIIWLPVAHGEGKFFTDEKTLEKIEKQKLVAFRYVDEKGNPTQTYPDNPNGALNAIAGITDTTGRILGLMPHPECFVRVEQHPNWRRGEVKHPQGLPLFENIVKFVREAKMILLIDFGGQTAHLISRRVRELGVECVMVSPDEVLEKVKEKNPKGIIFSGGPAAVFEKDAPTVDKKILELGIPMLGICYGHQLMGYLLGGKVRKGVKKEFGPATLTLSKSSKLFDGIPNTFTVWLSHGDEVIKPPEDFVENARTSTHNNAAISDEDKKFYGIQFHPEVVHTEFGTQILENFLKICNLTPEKSEINKDFVENIIKDIGDSVVDEKVICALSGGVDSSVAALLVHQAIGSNLTSLYIDSGLMRDGETDTLRKVFANHFNMNIQIIDAKEEFLKALKGVTDPEEKRKKIGKTFIQVFDREAKKNGAKFLVQGTIYSDVIESAGSGKHAKVIKSHHNVGGLPEDMNLVLIEPLRNFYKDEVRKIGKILGLPNEITNRQPFPGPGLAVRIIGEVTDEKLEILRQADKIVQEELKDIEGKLWQAFAVFTGIKTTGVRGDNRAYGETIAIRAIEAQDAMSANFAKLPYELLEKISTRIVNEIPQVNRVVYDITNKPPATMEWE